MNIKPATPRPINVTIIDFDCRSFFIVNSVIIDVEYAKTKKSAVRQKNCMFLNVTKLARMHIPTKNTVVLLLIIPF